MKVIIIGGVAGGASAAARLRRLDEKAEILLLERGEHISFANCGLPYYIGGIIKGQEKLTVQTPESFKARFHIDVRVNSEAIHIDPQAKRIRVLDKKQGRTYEESYDKLILSPGAEPVRPPIPGIDSQRVFTLRNIPDAVKIRGYIEREHPRSAVVAGGGYIGVEMAENLKSAGLDVTIVEKADHLIAPLDLDMAADVHRYAREKGIQILLNNGVRSLAEKEGRLSVTLDRGTVTTDMLLLSVGVRPESSLARSCGIRTNQRGSIVVNSHLQTSEKDIYAVGDAAEAVDFITGEPAFIPLAGPANRQGRIAADHLYGIDSRYTATQGTAVLKFFDMTVATTGLNERTASSADIDYDKTYLYLGSHAAYYPGAANMSIKALWDKKTLRLLGAQIVGFDGVDKRMDVLATAIRLGAKVTDLTQLELCYAPPFGSAKDPVNMLGFVAENIVSGRLKQFFGNEVDALPRDGSVTLLDVRTAAEVKRGTIAGFKHIPLDQLRDRLAEIPAGKPVYIHCHSGLRSYIACRILMGNGYDCYNLAGGWRLYESVQHEKTVPEFSCADCQS